MVKRDAGLCNVVLCAIDFEHDERSSFCETNPTSEQIEAAVEFRTGFRLSNSASNAEKSGHQMARNGQRSAMARSAKSGRRPIDDQVRLGRSAAHARSGDHSRAVDEAGALSRSATMSNSERAYCNARKYHKNKILGKFLSPTGIECSDRISSK
jgi:hypothetical protein